LRLLSTLKRQALLVIALLITLVATGCVGMRIGVSWAGLALVGAENYIFVAYNDFLVLVDPANGRPVPLRNAQGEIRTTDDGTPRRWEILGRDTGSEFFTAPVWLDDDRMLVADYNNRLFTIEYSAARVENPDGIPLAGHVIANPVMANGQVVLPFSDRDIVSLDVATYVEQWRFTTRRGIWSAPLLIDGVVYVASMDHNFYAVDAESGQTVWELNLGGALAAAPAYEDGRFYIGTIGRRIYEISIDGQILAEYETEDWVWSTPVIDDGILYTADLSGHVYALDIGDNLSEIWKSQPGVSGIRAQPLVVDNSVIVAARDGRVYWLERQSGVEIFNKEVHAEILSDMLLIEPTAGSTVNEPLVVVSTVRNDKMLVAFSIEGVERWTYER
jgi:outer membrane protein assembly factor BamB